MIRKKIGLGMMAVLLFLLPRMASGQDVGVSHAAYRDFIEYSSGYGYAEPMLNGSVGVTLSICSRAFRPSIGMKAEIVLRGSRISSIVSSVIPSSCGFSVGIVPVGKKMLSTGAFVMGKIIIGVHKHRVAVPDSAVLNKEGVKFVIIKEENSFIKRSVVTAISQSGFTEIAKGVKNGDEVVTAGSYEILHNDIGKEFKVED